MIEAAHYSSAGAKHKTAFALPADLFDGTVNEPVLHQAVKTYLNNQRQGTAMTKTRSFVSGGNQKPWRQKGTGRARQGTTRSPLWRGGGIVFGPIPRSYYSDIPRKVKQLARRSALNARAREGALFVLDAISFETPKTKQLVALLGKMGLEGKKVLLLSNGLNRNLYLSGRNVPKAQVMTFADVSAYDVLWSDAVVVEQGALTGDAPVAGEAAEPRTPAKKKTAKPAAKKTAAKRAPSRSEGKAPAKKPAAKKPAAKKKKES
ncbi:MAG: 50S ribosomal protein L4 [Gemmatimonadales bacterium]|nr:50S ribosomal protein L4 [Gemmatimonadales bacterium]